MSIEVTTVRAEADLLKRVPSGLYIDGSWIEAGVRALINVQDPATGNVIRSIASATPDDATAALDAAVAAQDEWAATSPRERSNVLRRAWELLQERFEDFALLMTLEMGKPIAEARGEVTYGGEFLRWFSEEAVRVDGRYGPNPEATGHMVITHRPVGPCFLITPWNFPLAMATRKIAPALAAGCTVVIKPAELSPLTTLLFAQLLEDAGVPAGVVNVIPTSTSRTVGARLIADPRLRKLSFTGSTEVGRALLKQAADNVLRTSMELGGNAPFIVFDDADIDAAVDGAVLAKFRNSGEACTAANRFMVHEDVAEDFVRKVSDRVSAIHVGRGTDPTVAIGPLIEPKAVEKTQSLVDDAVLRGATVTVGGGAVPGEGNFFQPTVLANVAAGSAVIDNEIFAPVLAITTFRDETHAVAVANQTEYGLAAYVYTSDLARGHRMIERIQTGMMGLNTGLISNAAAPFGGIKQSGMGREGGAEGIHEYLDTKYTLIPAESHGTR
jgi:succinate-semialdehyde dehydrogenase/glutarate-semialdehyde dehydrogenase